MVDREQDVLRAASMYYLQDMKMEAIAKHLHTSRSTVSRLVKRARDTGLVEISLRPARSRGPGLGQHLASTWGSTPTWSPCRTRRRRSSGSSRSR